MGGLCVIDINVCKVGCGTMLIGRLNVKQCMLYCKKLVFASIEWSVLMHLAALKTCDFDWFSQIRHLCIPRTQGREYGRHSSACRVRPFMDQTAFRNLH